MKKLKFGMVGGGSGSYIGESHIKGATFDGIGVFAAGCFSRDYQKSLKFGIRKGIDADRIYASYTEMAKKESMRNDGIDFVIIAAPNHIHYDCAKIFLEHGIHVVCDKPLANTSKEAKALMKLAKKKDLLFCVTYTHAAVKAVSFMKQLIVQNRLGNLRFIKVEYLSDNLAVPNEKLSNSMLWRLDREKAGPSTCCSDIGVHAQNLVYAITGLEIDEVSADLDVYGENRTLDTNFTATVRYKGGVKGHFWCSNIAIGTSCDLNIAIYGEKGSMTWHEEQENLVIYSELEGNTIQYRMNAEKGFYAAFANVYRNFMAALNQKKACDRYEKNYPDVEEGVKGLLFVEACVESSEQNGAWIKMESL